MPTVTIPDPLGDLSAAVEAARAAVEAAEKDVRDTALEWYEGPASESDLADAIGGLMEAREAYARAGDELKAAADALEEANDYSDLPF